MPEIWDFINEPLHKTKAKFIRPRQFVNASLGTHSLFQPYSRQTTFHLTQVLTVVSVWLHVTFSVNARGIKTFGHLRVTYWYLSLYLNSVSNPSLIFLLWPMYKKNSVLLDTPDSVICPVTTYPSSLIQLLLIARPSEQPPNSCYQKQTEISPLVPFFFVALWFFLVIGL